MAKTKKEGKNSKETEKLLKEEKETEKANAEQHEENVKVEAEKLEAAKTESDNQAPPIAVPTPLPDKKRAEAWKHHVAIYAEANPVKYAAKKDRGEFDNIPNSFTGRNELNIQL